jgi:cell wall-associated NlpC family hydrolase
MKSVLRNLTVVITLTLTLNVTALAVPTSGELQQQRNSITKIQEAREEIEAKIEIFDNEIEGIMARTEENKGKISTIEKQIANAAVEIKEIEKESEKEQELFNSRMRTMYINGVDDYLSILLDAESFGDFVSRVENIKTIIEFDKKVLAGFEATKKELSEKQQSLSKTKETLLSLEVENKQKLEKLIVTKESQNKLITELENKESLLAQQISESQLIVNESMNNINEIRKSIPKYTPSRGAVDLSENAVIAYASNFLGTPYLWGGTSPSTGFDCSGFTQYVYKHFGISLGRTTFNQINDGVQVSRDNLKAGDLVFFGASGSPSHMGIYVGNNTYIHSPRTGDVLKVSPMTRRDYITARRVM